MEETNTTTPTQITIDFDKAYALIDEFKVYNTEEQGWPHMLLTIDEKGEWHGSGISGRTDLVIDERGFFLLNAKWKSAETLKYAFWMIVRNRVDYFDLYECRKKGE